MEFSQEPNTTPVNFLGYNNYIRDYDEYRANMSSMQPSQGGYIPHMMSFASPETPATCSGCSMNMHIFYILFIVVLLIAVLVLSLRR